MKRLLFVVVFSFVASCAHVTPVVVDCGREVQADILPAVESALVAQDYVDELTKLVGKFGECVVRKAVEQITGEAIKDASFANDANAQRKAEHGRAWLAAHPAP